MDGFASTLTSVFAAVFATRKSHVSFMVVLSAAVGAEINMAFAEALSDTGEETGQEIKFFEGRSSV
jgi:hypothetical protein